MKVILDKTALVKFKITNNLKQNMIKHIQNNQKSIGKSIQPMESRKKICESKVSRFCQMFVISKKKTIPWVWI